MQTTKNTHGIIGQISRIREQANLLIEQELRNAGLDGLLSAHGSILNFLLKQTEPIAIKEVVQKVGRVKSTVTGMMNTLESHGYVRKFKSADDGRVILVELTEKGRGVDAHFKAISSTLQERVYGDMPLEERETLVQLLGQIDHNLTR